MGDQFLWGRDLLVAPVFTKGATSRDVYLPKGDWYDWWTNEKSAGRPDGHARRRSGDDADLRPRGRDHSLRSGSTVHERAVSEPTTLSLSRCRWAVHAVRGRWDQPGVPERPRIWTRIAWNDGARQLTLEPGGPRGATNSSPSGRSRFSCCRKGRRGMCPTRGSAWW